MQEFVRDDIVRRLAVNVERERINIEHVRHVAPDSQSAESRIAENAAALVCRIKEARRVTAPVSLRRIANVQQEQYHPSIRIHIRWRAEAFRQRPINTARTRRRCFLKRPENSINRAGCDTSPSMRFPFRFFNVDVTELAHTP